MIQKCLMGLSLLILVGCGGTSQYYVLSTAPHASHKTRLSKSIGVEQVILPSYMDKRELTVATSSNQIIQMNTALWAEDMDAGLTQNLISYLQKKFQQPNVFAYPWGVEQQPRLKIKLQINRFIAQGGKVYLDANYVITDLQSKKSSAFLFSTSVPTSSTSGEIVTSMNKAFGELEEHIATNIK